MTPKSGGRIGIKDSLATKCLKKNDLGFKNRSIKMIEESSLYLLLQGKDPDHVPEDGFIYKRQIVYW